MSVDRRRRVVLIEDHAAIRTGLALLLDSEGFAVVGEAGDADSGYETIARERPDVVLLDVGLPGESGVSLARRLLRRDSRLGILLYTGAEDPAVLSAVLDCGARGFAHKAAPLHETVRAVRAVAAGGSYIDPRGAQIISEAAPRHPERVLSRREREVMTLVAEGCSRQGLSDRLSISEETARTHVRNAMRKLEVHTRAQAVIVALKRGEITV